MRSRFRRISAREEGFTLVEVVITTALFMLVSVAILTLFTGIQRYSVRQASRSETMDQVRIAMERMTKEIRQATDIRAGSSVAYLDIDTYVNGADTRIVYDATSGTTVTRSVNGATPVTLLERLTVSALFGYSSTDLTEVSVITVNLTAQPEKFLRDEVEVSLRSEVQLRNRA